VQTYQTYQENLNTYSTYTFTTNSHNSELVGGRNQEWENISKKISQRQIEQTPHGDTMGKLAYELKNIKRTEFPIFLDPKPPHSST
jgi:DNA-binding transcriptional regulator/RsmH inhibitor MraZ